MALSLLCSAQSVSVISTDMLSKKSFQVKAHVVDSVSNENLSFVSAYLRFKSDTLITNFALSDIDGKVELNEVAVGDYILTVEYLGYEKYQKNFYVRKDSDLGEIRLKPDVKALKAASITAAGKEVEIKQDTIIFNATLFKTGSNDNLAALLKRMPGVEISEGGSVKVNGKEVDRITIEGKTFFMNDKSTALNSLPASIVERITVIDGDSADAKISGIKDINKERVMDVELKQEYKTGFFGNAKFGAGPAVPGGGDDEFLVTDRIAHNSSLMASLYDEKDQLTIIGNAMNITDGSSLVYVAYSTVGSADGAVQTVSLPRGGVHTTWSAGANLNTDRIKKVSSSVSAKFSSESVDYHNYSDRTTFQNMTDDLRDQTDTYTDGNSQNASVSAEFQNLNGKRVSFRYTPRISFSNIWQNSSSEGSSLLGDVLSNSSNSLSGSSDRSLSTGGNLNASLSGKNNSKRKLTMVLGYNLTGGDGSGYDTRSINYGDGSLEEQNITYSKDNNYRSLDMELGFVEPLSDTWSLQLTAENSMSDSHSDKAAFNGDGSANSLFSSNTGVKYRNSMLRVLGQYRKESTTMNVGARVHLTENVIESTTAGVRTMTGENDLIFKMMPYLTLSTSSKDMRTSYVVNLYGSTSTPGASDINPALRIQTPTRLSVGNLYLKPYYNQTLITYISGSTEKNSHYTLYFMGELNENSVSSASWFDQHSMMCSVPVNVKKPSFTTSIQLSYGGLITENGVLRYDISATSNYVSGISYQASGMHEGIDMGAFSYSDFMNSFWGNASGDIFYSGQSGFRESRTSTLSNYLYGVLRLKLDSFQMTASARAVLNDVRYSLDSRANISTIDHEYGLDATYFAKNDYELNTNLSCNTYRGYSGSFNDPRCKWNASVLKNVKALTFTVSVWDILNQAKIRSASWNENYSEYSYTNALGRCFLFSIKFNFGKMNAAKNSAAQNASLRMML